jgi:hypothetical protein
MASQVFGNVLAAYVFKQYDQVIFYGVMACFSLSSGVFFFFLKDPIKSSSNSNEPAAITGEFEL